MLLLAYQLILPLQEHWCEYYRMRFGLLIHNTNNGAESLHKSLKHTHFANQMHSLGLCELARRLAVVVLWKDAEAQQRILTQSVCRPTHEYDPAIPKWLRHKPRKCIEHCMLQLTKARDLLPAGVGAIRFTTHILTLSVDVTTTTTKDYSTNQWVVHEPRAYVISYVGTARQHGQDATRGTWLGCTCQQHTTEIKPCKHMCACWVFFGSNSFGSHTMPHDYFESPSMAL